MYFSCYSSSITYSVELADCLSFIENVLANSRPAVILGDMNFKCDVSNDGYRQLADMLLGYDISHCDSFLNDGICNTYVNDSLKQASFIDHLFVYNTIRQYIISAKLFDTGANLSDHIPLVYKFR